MVVELPTTRVQSLRPFLTTGVEYAGPISLRLSPPRSKTLTNVYIALFVFFMNKAVHIEVVTIISKEAFRAALRRFIKSPENPRTFCSDNSNNFLGAAKEYHAIYKILQSTSQNGTLEDVLATEGCEWKFIPPHRPHFGGLWEAKVKNIKYHLRRSLGSQVATYEELCTLLAEIEDCLNSRHLCTISDETFNLKYLYDEHLLIMNLQPITCC